MKTFSLIGLALLLFKINARHRTLHMRSMIIFLLATFAAWSLGSADWMLPVVAGFIIYNRLCAPCRPLSVDLTAFELLRPLYPMLMILFIANTALKLEFWFAPFVVATAVSSALCADHRFRKEQPPQTLRGGRLLSAVLLPCAIPLMLCLPLQGTEPLYGLPVALLLCATAVLLYNRYAPLPLTPFAWNYAIPLISGGTAAALALLQAAGFAPIMDPSSWTEVFRWR